MLILHRYVWFELLKVFLLALAALTLIILLFGVVREASNQGLGLAQIMRIVPFILPDALRFSVPGTLLFAVCSVYGRMSASNELVAVKSLGISPMRMVWPAVGFSVLLSLLSVWLNDVAVSWGTAGIRRVVVEEAAEIAYRILQKQKSYTTRQFTVTVKGVAGRKLLAPDFSFRATDRGPAMTVRSDEAELCPDTNRDTLIVAFRNAVVEATGGMQASYPEAFTIEIPLEDASRKSRVSNLPAYLPLYVIPERIRQQKIVIERMANLHAAEAALQMLTADFSNLTDKQWEVRATQRQGSVNYLHRLETEPYRRWAAGFSCLFFAIVGVPMAIRLRNCDVLATFFICFLPILVLYYPLLTYGIDAAKSGQLPPYCVWLANVVLAGLGSWLLGREMRH